jgi:hypothetical protein
MGQREDLDKRFMRAVNGRRGVCAFILLLLFLRGVFLLAALDPEEERVQAVLDVAGVEWSHGPERQLYDREELYTGTAAEAMRLGFPFPVSAYRFMAYGSGSLVVSLLARPVFALCGPTYLGFKLIPLLVSVLGGLCWFLVVRAWRGPRAAFAFGLLYALAPPVLVRTALIAKGDHAEAMAITGAVLLLATNAAFAATAGRRRAWAAGAGCAAGLGVFITYSTVPVTGAIALLALLLCRARPRDAWLAALGGLAVGFAPWLLTVLGTQGAALRVYNRPLGALVDPAEVARRLQRLFTTGFFAGYDLPGGWAPRRLAAWAWMAAVVIGWVRLARGRRIAGAWLVLAGSAAHLLAFLLAAPDASSRYLVPMYPLLLCAAALPWSSGSRPMAGVGSSMPAAGSTPAEGATGVAGGTQMARPGRAPAVATVGLAGLGLLSVLAVIATSGFPALRAPLKGYDWPLLGEVLGTKLSAEGVAVTPPAVRRLLRIGIGRRLAREFPPSAWPAEVQRLGPDASGTWEGIGMALAEQARVTEATDLLRVLPAEAVSGVVAGFLLYPEVVFLPILRSSGEVGVGRLLARFEGPQRRPADRAWARTRAVLLVQGVREGAAAATATSDGGRESARTAAVMLAAGPAAVPAGEAERAMGWALYRGRRRDGGPRFWLEPGSLTTSTGLAPLTASTAFWQGVAAAYRDDLGLRSTSWLLGREERPANLEADTKRFVQGMASDQAMYFQRAALDAARKALADPSRRPGIGERLRMTNDAEPEKFVDSPPAGEGEVDGP